MRILVLGINGQLGWELGRQGRESGFDIIPLDLPEFDITNPEAVEKNVMQSEASLVINASAYTAVDKAESEPELAFAVNCDGPGFLADSCAKADIPLIHISTDYVFDGNKKSPYLESDPISPMGVYGKSKAAGEAKVRQCAKEHIILRTAWLYGTHGQNFVKTILRIGRDNEVVRVVSDQFGSPTFAADLAEAALTIASNIRREKQVTWGTYHYCGRGVTSWYDFSVEIFRLAKQHESFAVKKVEPISTAEYPTTVKRPADSSLDCSSIGKCFDIYPKAWEKSLSDMIRSIY
jgi:dTDP-4-dehydrorhamnose reductase